MGTPIGPLLVTMENPPSFLSICQERLGSGDLYVGLPWTEYSPPHTHTLEIWHLSWEVGRNGVLIPKYLSSELTLF